MHHRSRNWIWMRPTEYNKSLKVIFLWLIISLDNLLKNFFFRNAQEWFYPPHAFYVTHCISEKTLKLGMRWNEFVTNCRATLSRLPKVKRAQFCLAWLTLARFDPSQQRWRTTAEFRKYRVMEEWIRFWSGDSRRVGDSFVAFLLIMTISKIICHRLRFFVYIMDLML